MDVRLRQLLIEAQETDEDEAWVRWALAAHRSGHRSLMPCLVCHGCTDCSCCPHSFIDCRECEGTGYAGLDVSTVAGSLARVRLMATLSGHDPKVKGGRVRSVVVDIFAGDVVDVDSRSRPPRWGERMKMLGQSGLEGVARRVALVFHDLYLAKDSTEARERAGRLLRVWAVAPCRVKLGWLWTHYMDDARRIQWRAKPWSGSSWGVQRYVEELATYSDRPFKEEDLQEALDRVFFPYLLGLADPIKDSLA